MHIANVIVKCRAHLANAEAHYGAGHKGLASEVLATLGVYLAVELPAMSLEASPEDLQEVSQQPPDITTGPGEAGQAPEQPGAEGAIAPEQSADQKPADDTNKPKDTSE